MHSTGHYSGHWMCRAIHVVHEETNDTNNNVHAQHNILDCILQRSESYITTEAQE